MANVNSVSRRLAAEGSVLLKNDGNLLPFKSGEKVAFFGRMQTAYYKSGTGSGGLVHLEKEPNVLESLRQNGVFEIDEELVSVYEKWVEKNPFNDGHGVWAGEPWYQEEMPLTENLVKEAASRNDSAVIILGRTAGEDHDNSADRGSYKITKDEEKMISLVTANFDNVVLALNVGNIIDLSFLRQYNIKSVLYTWQGGMEGANAFADVLAGKTAPSGKLCDTQCYDINDNPSTKNFGDEYLNIYQEDIYVGYRYFETFNKEAVQFPFGFGLTYTSFETKYSAEKNGDKILVTAEVKNTGEREGREVIQVYYKSPCGVLGTPSRALAAYKKTGVIAPNETEKVCIEFNVSDMASFDDEGLTGFVNAYVLQNGKYEVFAGTDVRSAESVLTFEIDKTTLVKQLEEACAPDMAFERMCAEEINGERVLVMRDTPLAKVDVVKRLTQRRPEALEYAGDCGIKLKDVKSGKNTLDEFIAQLNDTDLSALVCGEGMGSPKATPGTGGAFGGQTQSLLKFGIPVCALTDGPSGIRRDTGETASLVPNGACVASTWDDELVEELYSYIGYELKEQNIDALLGPGMNIHRSPICGRNFEYFSEDPIISGKIAAAMTRGLAAYGASSTIKHFCCNNQETGRNTSDSVVSQRALREIYLKGFEIAVHEGKNILVMTTYGILNGYYTATNYDLNTTILRGEWGFDGFVMTDWWARCNTERHGEGDKDNAVGIVRSQNDLYTVCNDAITKGMLMLDGLESGYITRGELQRSVRNILNFILKSNTFETFLANGEKNLYYHPVDESALSEVLAIDDVITGKEYTLNIEKDGPVLFEFNFVCTSDFLSQTIVNLHVTTDGFYYINEKPITLAVPNDVVNIMKRDVVLKKGEYTLKFESPEVVKLKKLTIYN